MLYSCALLKSAGCSHSQLDVLLQLAAAQSDGASLAPQHHVRARRYHHFLYVAAHALPRARRGAPRGRRSPRGTAGAAPPRIASATTTDARATLVVAQTFRWCRWHRLALPVAASTHPCNVSAHSRWVSTHSRRPLAAAHSAAGGAHSAWCCLQTSPSNRGSAFTTICAASSARQQSDTNDSRTLAEPNAAARVRLTHQHGGQCAGRGASHHQHIDAFFSPHSLYDTQDAPSTDASPASIRPIIACDSATPA